MERSSIPNIREIVIFDKVISGEPYRIHVGHKVKAGGKVLVIEAIKRDENAAMLMGCLKYDIYVSVSGSKEGRWQLWRSYESCRTEVISEIDEE